MNAVKKTTQLALSLFITMTGMFTSCVEDEQAPFSGGEGSGFYVQLPGYGEFYWGSEVVLKGNSLSEISKIYVEGISPDMDEDKLENGDYANMADMNGDGIPDEFQRIEARITERTDKELTFILPANTTTGSAMVYYERGEELRSLNVLNNIMGQSINCYLDEEAGKYIITIYGDTPSAEDRVYVQYIKYDYNTGESVPVTGEWIEAPLLSSDETSLQAQPVGVGEMRVRYVHNGEEIVFPYTVNVEPMYIIRFPEGDYYAGDEVTITGGFFEEGDVITLNSIPVEIVSIDTELDALTFRIPEDALYNQHVWLYRNGLDYFVKEIYVQERNQPIQ